MLQVNSKSMRACGNMGNRIFPILARRPSMQPMTHKRQLRAEWHNSAVVQLAASFDRCDQQNRSFACYSWLDSHVPAPAASCLDKALIYVFYVLRCMV